MFFIVGCGRSGTTAVTKLLSLDTALTIRTEPSPFLADENASLSQNRSFDMSLSVRNFFRDREERLERMNDPLYIEKQVTLGPFIQEIHKQSNAKFIYVYRDGREVVSSWMNWHKLGFGSIYREAGDQDDLHPRARKAALSLLSDHDKNERSRPRLFPDTDPQASWLSYSRFEMLCHMWAKVNSDHLDNLLALPEEDVFFLNTNALTPETVNELFKFLGRPEPDPSASQTVVEAKINSPENRGFDGARFPSWMNWAQSERDTFKTITESTMKRLKYWDEEKGYWRPKNFGSFWKAKEHPADWYDWMFNHRRSIHQTFFNFVTEKQANGEAITSIIDLGCGTGHGYVDQFKDISYLGLDLNRHAIQAAGELALADGRTKHVFKVRDYLQDGIPETADIVMSSGTLDNVYDVPLCLEGMVAAAKKYIYFTAYRGWFPELKAHKYNYVREGGYFQTDVSPTALVHQLSALGCTDIQCRPLWTEHDEIPFETEVWARVPAN